MTTFKCKRIALAVLVVAAGALLHFWPENETRTSRVGSAGTTTRDMSANAPAEPEHPQASAAMGAATGKSVAPSIAPGRSAVSPVQITLHAPQTARLDEIFPVTIELQAMQGVRQLEFSVVYEKQILELVESSLGPFARPGGPSGQFEEVSEGSLLVRVEPGGGLVVGAGSVAVVQFRTVRRGVSPLAINGVRYVVEGRQNESSDPVAYEGTITVE